ncbi:MAG TPA: hypothetical protein VK824_00230 [Planctomycetota bacterium]|nr:hypothetical protein [Planctomycetota bacterium]
MERPTGLLKREGLTLLLMLGLVYVFATATLPALLERHELARRREATQAEVDELVPKVQRLAEWNEAAANDPLTRQRLLESWKLSPDAPGYRVLPDPGGAAPGDAGKK